MKKFYSFFKLLSIAAVTTLTLLSSSAFAQGSICGPIVENFNNTSGSTNGFTGSFSLQSTGSNGNLIVRSVVGTGVYSITTPTYKLPNNATSLGYGFVLDGTEKVARIIVKVVFISTLTGNQQTLELANFVPNYGASTTTTVCVGLSLSTIPGFPTGGSYRFQFDLVPNSGDGRNSQTVTFDDFRTNGDPAPAALPVNFMAFDAKKVSSGIQVTWKVAGEENVNRYEVERSLDGRNFTTLSTVATDKKDTYTYFDPSSNGTVYYRIKNVDNDGKYKYSTIARLVNGKSEIVLKAFPQPVLSQLTLQHPVIKGTSVVTVTTADGRLVKSIKPTTGSMQTFVDMSNLQGGMYMVRFDSGDGNVETMKVVKQ
ncbi:MAG: T9SS type A sorting domain-containing protein [Sphingobacteriales bacterium]|nr:MAG: T9SS type A sorting domain-containing protein [Sphingobacteriales bacterium]